jgi:hypothetical protein
MKIKPYFLPLVILLLLALTASSAFGVGNAGTVTGGTFPVCVDPASSSTALTRIGGKLVSPGGLLRISTASTCTSAETTLNLNSYLKTVLVSPSGADNLANGTLLQTALSAASPGTLIKLEPGTYNLGTTPLTMKQEVDLEGSGEGLTKIISQVSENNTPTTGAVILASSNQIRFLTISNTATNGQKAAVYASGVDNTARLTNVTISINGSSSNTNYGLYLANSAAPLIQNSTISVTNGYTNVAVAIDSGASATIQNSTITVSGGFTNDGIAHGGSLLTVQNSTISSSGPFGSTNISVSITNISTARIATSQLSGTFSGLATCIGDYNASFSPLGSNCN